MQLSSDGYARAMSRRVLVGKERRIVLCGPAVVSWILEPLWDFGGRVAPPQFHHVRRLSIHIYSKNAFGAWKIDSSAPGAFWANPTDPQPKFCELDYGMTWRMNMKKRKTRALWMALLFYLGVTCIVKGEDTNAGKAIELILDCSGSMNAVLPSGTTRIDAARKAVSKVVNSLPSDTQIAFRAYGHQSPREKGDCNDTALLVPFDSLSKNQTTILSHVGRLKASGYTPITKVLEVSVADFPRNESGEKMIILVSDGKETCSGDPCAAARAIQNAGVKLAIHTVGFAVDDATRLQLKCIADATGGTYFDAENADQLEKVINQAAVKQVEKIVIEKKGSGKLQVKNAGPSGHKVTDAETGNEVGNINIVTNTIDLPAGLYNVKFGASTWQSVRVENGKTTVLEPGVLSASRVAVAGHDVTDSETGVLQGHISLVTTWLTLMPGMYDVSFGKNLVWSGVIVNAGSTTTLNPGVLKIINIEVTGHRVYTSDNKEIGQIDFVSTEMPLPPGDYFVEIEGQKRPVKMVEGKEVIFELTQK